MTTSLVWCQALLRGTMFNCKAVIFDMDGVIIDSEGLWREAQREHWQGGAHVSVTKSV